MALQENFLALAYSNSIKCNVVVLSHIIMDDDETTMLKKGLPAALGSKLPPKVGGYFNSVLHLERRAIGLTSTRVLRTASSPTIDLKSSAPSRVPAEMEADLAKYFALVRGV